MPHTTRTTASARAASALFTCASACLLYTSYADTCDALSSYGDREKKLEILKDPHCGAFAVIRLCSYLSLIHISLPASQCTAAG